MSPAQTHFDVRECGWFSAQTFPTTQVCAVGDVDFRRERAFTEPTIKKGKTMLRLHKTIFATLVFVAIACGSATTARADVFTFTLPNFNGSFVPPGLPLPAPAQTVGTFNIVIPAGQPIIAASLTGTFGNAVNSSSAASNLFLDGILVAQCAPGAACTGGGGAAGPTPFSFAFTAANLALLADGAAVLTAVQTGPGAIRLGQLALRVETIPEPATVVLLGTGIAAVGASLRRRRSERAKD